MAAVPRALLHCEGAGGADLLEVCGAQGAVVEATGGKKGVRGEGGRGDVRVRVLSEALLLKKEASPSSGVVEGVKGVGVGDALHREPPDLLLRVEGKAGASHSVSEQASRHAWCWARACGQW